MEIENEKYCLIRYNIYTTKLITLFDAATDSLDYICVEKNCLIYSV